MTVPDIIVVGGVIVGIATADSLVESGARVLVLEASDGLAAHQTGHNSGVVHSGLYYRPGSQKARTCIAGREALYAFCAEESIDVRRCGKLVVATREEELERLLALEERGKANGLRDLERLDGDGIRRREPAAAGIAGLWVAETGVVDFAAVTRALAARLVRRGGEVRTGVRVTGIHATGDGVRVDTTAARFTARGLVGCAGLQSDRLARLAGSESDVAIIPFRGEYYELRPERAGLVRGLIYPVPDPELPFLGVHFTRRIDGRVEAGPNAVLALRRDGYRRWDAAPGDIAAILGFPGFWPLARRFWRTGMAEMGRSWSKVLFVRALRRLVPAVQAADLRWGSCGVRAQAVDRSGRLLDDFHVVTGESCVHLVNAPSPAATAALSLGRQLAALVRGQLGGSAAGG